MTVGEDRIRIKFNPSNDSGVSLIKARAAELVDLCEAGRMTTAKGETGRLFALAQTYFEIGAMFAVKAMTA